MSPVRCDTCPPWWCARKMTSSDASQNSMVTLRGSARGGLNQTQRFTGAVMALTPGGTGEMIKARLQGAPAGIVQNMLTFAAPGNCSGIKYIHHLCAFLFQPSRHTTSRDSVRQNRGAWLAERGADVGSTERRTKDSAEQQSWERWLLLASHLLGQVHLKTVKQNDNLSVSWFKKTENNDSWRETHSFLCWVGICRLPAACLGRPGWGRSPRPGLRCERWQTDGCPPPHMPPFVGTSEHQPARWTVPSSAHPLAPGFSESDAVERDLQKA